MQSERSGCWLTPQRIGRCVSKTYHPCPVERPTLSRITRLPEAVTRLRAPLKPYCSSRPYVVFCGIWVAHVGCCEKAPRPALARHLPSQVAAWHWRRLLAAGRWQGAQGLEGLVSQARAAFPAPRDGVR